MNTKRPVLRPSPERPEPTVFQARLDKAEFSTPAEALAELAQTKELMLYGSDIVAGFVAEDEAHGVALLLSRKIEVSVVSRKDGVEASGPRPVEGLYETTSELREEDYLLYLAGEGKQRLAVYHVKDDESLVPDSAFGTHNPDRRYESVVFEPDEETGRTRMKMARSDGSIASFAHFEQ